MEHAALLAARDRSSRLLGLPNLEMLLLCPPLSTLSGILLGLCFTVYMTHVLAPFRSLATCQHHYRCSLSLPTPFMLFVCQIYPSSNQAAQLSPSWLLLGIDNGLLCRVTVAPTEISLMVF
jgi:hypothetical protein